jgi:hypothetical protein
MFSVSKKSILLAIIFFTAFNIQCSEPQTATITGTLQIKSNDISEQENSSVWKMVTLFGPAITTWALTQAIQKYYEDPEIATNNKELKKTELEIKKIELETKKHPDYPAISLQLKKNKAEEKSLINREKQLELEFKNGQLMEHYEERLDHFRKCDEPLTQDYCNNMTKIYQKRVARLTELRS